MRFCSVVSCRISLLQLYWATGLSMDKNWQHFLLYLALSFVPLFGLFDTRFLLSYYVNFAFISTLLCFCRNNLIFTDSNISTGASQLDILSYLPKNILLPFSHFPLNGSPFVDHPNISRNQAHFERMERASGRCSCSID